jgi:hypothetical protein
MFVDRKEIFSNLLIASFVLGILLYSDDGGISLKFQDQIRIQTKQVPNIPTSVFF